MEIGKNITTLGNILQINIDWLNKVTTQWLKVQINIEKEEEEDWNRKYNFWQKDTNKLEVVERKM